ncbi:MAG: tRNA (adenosine(37)-N6)-dimethylallyltransferase MiaA [Candidatus Paceibacterota bacterium]|jgi:tRNA-2-methylthio-N6-dimethylallyladenosine synthase
MNKYHIITFGCQMNRSDSERIAAFFEKKGFVETTNIKEANKVIINMCSVRQSAVDRVYGLLPQLQKLKAEIIITGCILNRDKEKLSNNFTVLNKRDFKKDFFSIIPKYSNNIQAFVPISDGCNNFCTYCAVPFTRGKLVSRDYKQIIKEIKLLVKKGYKEIWLLGENVNQYSYDNVDFADLIKKIDRIEGDFWVKFTSPNPKDFNNKIISAFSEASKFTPYLNLPLQSGDNDILKAMNRPYTAEKYYQLIEKIRKKIDNISISTDIIVGFPGETKKHFENTEKLFERVGFGMAYISQYSPRPQSLAFNQMKDDVTKKDKREREKILNDILKKSALKENKKFLRKVIDVLILDRDGDYFTGRTGQNKAIRFKSNRDVLGTFQKIKVTKVSPWNLEGELIKPKLIVIVGPTASGKTDLVMKLAKKFNGEIVSADSQMIYKEMNIGTAKPPKKTHYMVDLIRPDEEYNVALYKQKAIEIIDDIIRRGKQPFLVGGTGLYIKAITDNLTFPHIERNEKLRNKLEKKTIEELFLEYQKIDKEGSKIIDRKNKRRLIRAIEVSKALGESFFKERKEEKLYDCIILGIKTNKEELEKNIQKRVEVMFRQGLEKEARKIYKKYGVLKTIGYQEWEDYFKKRASIDEVKNKIINNTIKYSKRQITWFKKDKTIKWI